MDLQRTLLKKLVTLSSNLENNKTVTVNSITPPSITNQNEYKQLFVKYLNGIVQKDEYSKEILIAKKSKLPKDRRVSGLPNFFLILTKRQLLFIGPFY